MNIKLFDKLNTLPVITWRWLKVNDINVKGINLPNIIKYKKSYLEQCNLKDVVIKEMRPIIKENEKLQKYFEVKESFGVSKELVELGENMSNSGVFLHIHENVKVKEIIRLSYELDCENPIVIDNNLIVAEENSEVTVVMDFTNSDNSETFHNGVTKIYAKDNSVVNMVKIQRMNDVSNHFDSNVAFEGYGAKVNWISVELGALNSITNIITNLDENTCESNLDTIYFGDGDRTIDLSYIMSHRGLRSNSNILVRGALKDKAKKVFRGTLDFKLGSRRAKGNEEEYTLLLDKTVKSDAIPLLLCSEDDVEGQHAASAGQIDSEKLFYLMSRGLSEKEAKKLIVEASFRPIIDKIPLEDLREIIEKEIHRRLVNE